jgi:hypothetical protein
MNALGFFGSFPVNGSGSQSLPVSDFILPSFLIAETSSSAYCIFHMTLPMSQSQVIWQPIFEVG